MPKKQIISLIKESGIFKEVTENKSVDNFIRLVAHYNGFTGEKDTVFIDLNKRGTLLKKPEENKINHFYSPFIPEFKVKTLAKEEMIAEKLRATITRNKPRDHYDIYMIIKNDFPINVKLAEEKCRSSGEEFSIIRMFNKANKLKFRWDKDMNSLISEPITFEEVIKSLAKHFKLKEHKEKKKAERKKVTSSND
jgi:predicted nucleotidyltransferase component of viral defense system